MSWKAKVAKWLDVVPPERVIERVEYRVIEVKQPRIREWDKETKDAVSTLPAHPGFIALMNRFDLQRQLLQSKNNTQFKKDLREADFIQAGIYWLGYAQEQVDKATQLRVQPKVGDPFQEELDAFKEIDAQIERVGMD